jgi:Mn-containing catalase
MLKELLIDELQDIYHAERQLVKALPKMAKAAKSAELKEAFQNHLTETQGHVDRLTQAFELLGEKAKGTVCRGMMGLVDEGQDTIAKGKEMEEEIADLALIGAAQRVEHYEISAYGTARTIAEQLGQDEVVELLEQTLEEEKGADETLTKIAGPLLENSKNGDVEGEEEEEEDVEEEEVEADE